MLGRSVSVLVNLVSMVLIGLVLLSFLIVFPGLINPVMRMLASAVFFASFSELLSRDLQGLAMRRVAEMFARDAQQFGVAAGCVI